MQKKMSYHDSVLLKESVDALKILANGVYVDATYGGGGHSKEILSRLGNEGKLYAFDQDADAQVNSIEDDRFLLIPQNFRYMKNYLNFYKVFEVYGILADFGVSSHQFDEAKRGFSIRYDGPLDMRMNQNQQLTAKSVINEYSEEQLADILFQYGEIRNARKVASEIVQARTKGKIKSTQQLVAIFDYIPEARRNKFLAKLFQAIRIEVNDELGAIKEFLKQSYDLLLPGGRLVVISYHSLEDRLVKKYLKTGLFEGEPEKDVFGNWFQPWTLESSKVITPTQEEIQKNPRARSAKMRIGIKNG